MTTRTPDRSRTARLVELVVADDPAAWSDAGFAVDGDVVRLGPTAIRLIGRDGDAGGDDRRGIIGWSIAGVVDPGGDHLDGLPTTFVREVPDDPAPDPTATHPNGATGIDHVVVLSPDLDRTVAAFAEVQLPCRRIRDTGEAATAPKQAFFRIGPVIVEVVGPAGAPRRSFDEPPSSWFGIAVDVDDLDRAATLLGDRLGPVKPAVQTGRRIATLRGEDLGLSTAVAAMDDHADRETGTSGD